MNRAGEVFDAARADFLRWSNRLWRPLGEVLVSVARPSTGDRVLDACCGAGASALPAAHAVGPTGAVDAVDLAAALVAEGAREATEAGLSHLRFHVADVRSWPSRTAAEPYDVVQCGYGVFFLPDLDADAKALCERLRPGGRFTVSTWLSGGMERIVPVGRAAAAPERPDLAGEGPRGPSARLDTEARLHSWLDSLGLVDIEIRPVEFRIPLHPDDAWSFYLGAAMRAFVEGLPQDALDRTRARFTDGLRRAGIDMLDASSLIGVGHVPA